ncbi:MAG: glycosyltransferase family 9 protein [Ignavibacteria bacterium]|nr:glycosyltransferase family 9 protein [Ignavibacteria bacterium]
MDINPKSILVVQIGKLGDMVLTSPLFYELKRLFPKSKLKVLASTANQEFVSQIKIVDEVIVYQKNVLKDLFLANKLKKSNFDLWIDVKDGYSRTSASLLKLAKPKLSLGYNTQEKIFDVDLKDYAKGKHAVELSLAPVYYFGNQPVYIAPVLTDFLKETADSPIDLLINISAGSPSRYLNETKWLHFLSQILHKYPSYKIHLTGIERDAKLLLSIYNNFKTEHITCKYNYNLPELVNSLNRANIIISADTSIVHLASGLNKPIIALYPNVDWNLERFKPLSDNYEVITSKSDKGIEDIDSTVILEKYEELADIAIRSKSLSKVSA